MENKTEMRLVLVMGIKMGTHPVPATAARIVMEMVLLEEITRTGMEVHPAPARMARMEVT